MTRNKGGRPKGYPKSGGIVRGQRWSRGTVADLVWASLSPRAYVTPKHVAWMTGLNTNTIKHLCRLWWRGGALDWCNGYRRLRSHRPVAN